MMNDEQHSPAEQKIIQQLQKLPKPKIDPHIREALREQMLSEFRNLTLSEQPISSGILTLRLIIPLAAAVLLIVIGIGIVLSGLLPVTDTTLTISPSTQVVVLASITPETQATLTSTATAFIATTITPLATSTPPSATQANNTLSPTPIATLETIIIVEGNITNIVNNVIQIYDLNIEVEPQHPILNLVGVGDFVRVEGTTDNGGRVLASVVGNVEETTVVDSGITVSLEGLIESIENNRLIVNGIPVQLNPGDPLLQTFQVGNFIKVQGNFEGSGDTIVLVVVNITLTNNTTIQPESNCWYHEGMGMGHWHCDGMGMGMGEAMGMGMGMGQ